MTIKFAKIVKNVSETFSEIRPVDFYTDAGCVLDLTSYGVIICIFFQVECIFFQMQIVFHSRETKSASSNYLCHSLM